MAGPSKVVEIPKYEVVLEDDTKVELRSVSGEVYLLIQHDKRLELTPAERHAVGEVVAATLAKFTDYRKNPMDAGRPRGPRPPEPSKSKAKSNNKPNSKGK